MYKMYNNNTDYIHITITNKSLCIFSYITFIISARYIYRRLNLMNMYTTHL